MKTLYKFSAIALMSVLALNISAQGLPKFGIEAGVNLSNSSWDANPLDKKAKVGFQVGITADYAITNEWYLQSGLSFTTKGSKIEGRIIDQDWMFNGKITVNQSYLQLPIYAAYKLEVLPGTKIVFNAGPYLAYGLGSKTKLDGNKAILDRGETISNGKIDIYESDNFLNRFDFGLGAGVGAEFGNIVATIRYELGLTNLGKDGLDYKNRNAALTLGYRF